MKKWHIPGLSELEKELDTFFADGLSVREARERLERERRENRDRDASLFVPGKKPAVNLLFVYLGSLFALLLPVTALLAAAFGEPVLGFSVLAVALAAVIFGGIINLRARRRLEGAREFATPMVRVKRGGNVFRTDGRNLVKGDVIIVKAGDMITCDARIVRCERLVVNELIGKENGLSRRSVLKSSDAVYSSDSGVEAPDADNMLYAGSSVSEGNAVAVVVAVGDETYLSHFVPEGALGGKETEPEVVKSLRPSWYKASFLCASGLLILTLIGFLTFRGNVSFISYFTMLLSAIFLITTELLSSGTRNILSSYIYRTFRGKNGKKKSDNTAIIRDVKALESLTDVTDVVLLGKAGFSEGVFKVSGFYASGVSSDSLTPETKDGARLLELIHTYVKAQREGALDNPLKSDGVVDALYLHLKDVDFDISGASLILRSVFFATDTKTGEGFACAETDKEIYRTALLDDVKYTRLCDLVRVGGTLEPMTDSEMKRVAEFFRVNEEKSSKCLICVSECDNHTVLEGVIALEQPLDRTVSGVVSQASSFGVRTTVLLLEENEQIKRQMKNPSLSALFDGNVAYASEFVAAGKDILSDMGKYCAYVGFSVDEYKNLLLQLRKKGRRIAAFGVDSTFNEVMACSDLSVSCDMVNYASPKYRDAVYERLPGEGRDTNVRASQQTRLLSKVIVKRVHSNGGGIFSLFKAIRMARGAYVSVGQSMLLFILLMSGLLGFVTVSVLTGTLLLDPLQTVALSSVFAFLSITVFTDAELTDKVISVKREYSIYPYELIKRSAPDVVARASAAALTALVVKVLDTTGIFGEHPVYTLPIYICLLFSLFSEVFFINRGFTRKGEGRSYCWLKVVVAYAVLLGACALSTLEPFASTFYPNGYGSFEYFIIPGYVVLYFIGMLIARIFKNKRK